MANADPWATYHAVTSDQVPYPAAQPSETVKPKSPPPPVDEPLSKGYPLIGEYVVVWQVMDWGNQWIDYDKAFCCTLEAKLSEGAEDLEAKPRGNVTYRYNLKEMYQENLVTMTRRSMRRTLWWVGEADKHLQRQNAVEEYNKVHSNPKAGRRVPSTSRERVRSRSQSQARGSGSQYLWGNL